MEITPKPTKTMDDRSHVPIDSLEAFTQHSVPFFSGSHYADGAELENRIGTLAWKNHFPILVSELFCTKSKSEDWDLGAVFL